MSVVSLADVKAFENKLSTADDTELQHFIDRAEAILATRIGPLSPTAVSEVHDGGRATILLRRWPVVSLTSVTYADGTTVDASQLTLDPAGVIHWNYGTAGCFAFGSRGVTVVYQAGRSSLPEDLTQAVLELVRHLWESQRGGSTAARPSFDAADPTPTSTYLLPYRVESLIGPYKAPRVA